MSLLYANDDPNIGQNAPTSNIKPWEDSMSHAQSQQNNNTSSSQSQNSNDTSANNGIWVDNVLWLDDADLRNGNVNMDTIPLIMRNMINFLLGIAGTVAIASLIYHAVQMQINSGITGDSSGVDKAKKWMIGSLIGFVIAILAWFIVIRFVEILSYLSN
jgi:hypothetical protein